MTKRSAKTARAGDVDEARVHPSLNPDHCLKSDGTPVDDLLKRQRIVDAIAGAILTVDPPFTLGIYGGWGSGKTHFMKSVQEAIDKENNSKTRDQKVITVWYEAWQHQREVNPALSMLFSAYDSLSTYNKALRLGKEVLTAVRKTLFDLILPEVEIGLSVGLPDLASSASAKVKLSPNAARENWAKYREEEKERRFQVAEEQTKLQECYKKVLDTLSDKGKYKVVFFIDDLDRCLPKTVIDMLEKTRLFLAHESCVFVIGADSEAVEYAIQKDKGYDERQGKGEETARLYLEKIVNFPFRLPLISGDAITEFLANKLEAQPDSGVVIPILQTACDEKGASLRHMIQLTNTFILNDSLVRTNIEGYQAGITAVITALQVLWAKEFNTICKSEERREKNLQAFFLPEDSSSTSEPGFLDEAREKFPRLLFRAGELVIPKDVPFLSYVEFLASASTVSTVVESPDLDARYESQLPYTWYTKIPERTDGIKRGNLDETVAWIVKNPPVDGAEPKPKVTLDGYAWRVLTVSEGKALLVSEQIIGEGPLDAVPEDSADYQYTWAECLLNHELNSDQWLSFYLPQLAQSGRISDKVPSNYPSNEQLRKVFLLSEEDLHNKDFFSDGNSSRAATDLIGRAHWWWLRSPGFDAHYAAGVYADGSVYHHGYRVMYADGGVRPAFWLNLKS